ncbi:MAG: 3-oxoacyl-[acyl-carrier-protein] reductase [Flavobacteriales bacterium]|nr:3-oxoacyl-[acyl-carrier-protein] reductase [Flavobacteriales bacterium]|tara:strand:+ start:2335 stop:3081 length:747 start_codon:yes stop_codon:yes gene_type:complete
MNSLENKTAIVTGGTRGIGKGICLKLAQNKVNVVFTYLSSKEKALEIENDLKKFGIKVKGIKSDVSNYSECENVIDYINDNFNSIDILINNAGITRDNLLMRMTKKDFDKVIDTNLTSIFNMTKVVQKNFLKQRSGSIINISSIVGVRGNAGQSNYAASKAGVIGFTKSIALELGSRNIRCNAIAPGFIETEMTKDLKSEIIENWKKSIPLKKTGTVDDVANTVLFLASDMSKFITGQTISVCGGMLT